FVRTALQPERELQLLILGQCSDRVGDRAHGAIPGVWGRSMVRAIREKRMNLRCRLKPACLSMLLLGLAAGEVTAQALEAIEPFKVGTFAINDRPTLGLVLRDDQLVVDLLAANRAMEVEPRYAGIPMPADMLGLIEQYEYGLKFRIYEVVNWLVAGNLLDNDERPGWIHAVDSVDIMAPIQYPGKIMNAAVNFYTHACEGCSDDELQARIE